MVEQTRLRQLCCRQGDLRFQNSILGSFPGWCRFHQHGVELAEDRHQVPCAAMISRMLLQAIGTSSRPAEIRVTSRSRRKRFTSSQLNFSLALSGDQFS
jgi:hypothetical protein